VVDDDGVNRKVLCSIIKHYNKVGLDIQVEECSNGLESIRKVCSTHYDIIFMDINMPEMDGIEATKCIRDIYRTRNIEKRPSIIIASAYNKNDMGARAEVAGCDGYIMKPLKGDEVWNIIVNILNKKGGKCE
jgi:CheY-like chemotaxis protein